jgi:hypothetical protein
MAGAHRHLQRLHQSSHQPKRRLLMLKSVRLPETLPVRQRRHALRPLLIKASGSLSRRCLRLQAVSRSV